MNFNLPWINSRRRFLLAVFVDGLINIIFYSLAYKITFDANPNFIVPYSLASFWIILSYIFGRYMIHREIKFKDIIITIIKTGAILLLCNFIYLTVNWSNKFIIYFLGIGNELINIDELKNIFFLKVTILISLFSFFIQYFLSIFTYKIYSPNKYWLFYGSNKDLLFFKREIIDLGNNLEICRISSNSNLNAIIYEKIKGVILGNNVKMNQKDIEKIFYLKSRGLKIINVLNWCENQLHRIPPYMISNKFKIIDKFNSIDYSYNMRIKRIGDFVVSLFLLLITMPINILIAILIYLEDNGPIFYSQVRTGFRGEKISILKFRSMVIDAEKYGPQWAKNEDKRITKIGKIIRAIRFDELPQLLSVLEGSMSLIGPRPERPEIEKEFLEEIPYYNFRTILKPGISGWAQVNYPYGASLKDTIHKLSYDIYYINHISFLLDIFILFKTIKIVFNAKGYKSKDKSL